MREDRRQKNMTIERRIPLSTSKINIRLAKYCSGVSYFIGIFIANKMKLHISIEVSRKEFSLRRRRFFQG